MPKVRKKTSKRVSLKDRESKKKKVKDGRKKNRKLAKKDVTWKSRVKKDPGMPNSMPFKDLIIAEMEQAKLSEEQERERQKELQRKLKSGEVETMSGVSVIAQGKTSAPPPSMMRKTIEEEEEEAPPLIDHTIPDLDAVLDRSDIVVQILDVRDPLSFRLPEFEKAVAARGKKHIFLLNKIDLVPRESVTAWCARLRKDLPTLPFRSASGFLPDALGATTTNKGKGKAVYDDEIGSASLQDLLLTIAPESPAGSSSSPLTVAFVGLTNSGKSSVINSILHHPIQPVYKVRAVETVATPTTTLYPRAITQKLEIKGRPVVLIDTPGFKLSKPEDLSDDEGDDFSIREMLLRRRGKFEKIKESVRAVTYLVSRSNTGDLMVLYNAPAFQAGDAEALMKHVARSTGRLNHRGVPDLQDAATSILRDWRTGKLTIYTMPPKASEATSDSPAPPFDGLYTAADSKAFGSLKTLKELVVDGVGLNLVRFKHGEPLDWSVNLSARYEPPVDRQAVLKRVRREMEEEAADDEDEDEDGMEVDESNEDEDEDESDESDNDRESFGGIGSDEDEGMESPPPSSAKRKAAKPPAKRKKVSFESERPSSKGHSRKGPSASSTARAIPKKAVAPTKNGKVVKDKQALKIANQPVTSSKAKQAVTSDFTGASDAPYDFSTHFGV